MVRRLGAIGAFASFAALALAGEASAAFPGANGKIAFVNYRDGDAEIFRMNPNGSDKERLTRNSAVDDGPSFAPGGRRIVFASGRDGDFEIYVMRSNGTRQRQLTRTSNSAYDNSPSFSPNGKRILFTRVSERPGRPDITNLYVMRADGSSVRRLIRKRVSYEAAWSPNGKRIVFTAIAPHGGGPYGGGLQLWAMRPDGTHKRQLTQSVGRARFALNYDPNFSPNGKRILFTRQRHSFNAIRTWVMRSDGSNPHPLPRNRRHGGAGAVFSPNGKRILLTWTPLPRRSR